MSLPKGGGAIKGIGEKFAANPVTGTGSMSVPIATSPGRSGFGPQLSLSYDAGAGNGPFGIGWNLSLPSITQKTDQGLPRYFDTAASDVFILSGAEDLVPVLVEVSPGKWIRESLPNRPVNGASFRIDRYRPRIEGLFARIERWSNVADNTDVRWRSISKDNLTTWYGADSNSRIADPADRSHIFSWLICQSYDDKGNAMLYQYAQENADNVATFQANETNRKERSANRYLKRIFYGNATSTLASGQPLPPLGPDLSAMSGLCEVVLDYGEGHYRSPSAPADDSQHFTSG